MNITLGAAHQLQVVLQCGFRTLGCLQGLSTLCQLRGHLPVVFLYPLLPCSLFALSMVQIPEATQERAIGALKRAHALGVDNTSLPTSLLERGEHLRALRSSFFDRRARMQLSYHLVRPLL
jgi:hypothetical protein